MTTLPPDWDHWTLEQKDTFLDSLRYDWRNWARPNQLPPDGDWDVWILLAGRGFGKLAATDTPILRAPAHHSGEVTNFSWSTMGDVRLGDHVLAPDGTPTRVIGAYDETIEDEYLVRFSDGTEISVGATHEWVTFTNRDRKQVGRYSGQVPDEWWSFSGSLFDAHRSVVGSFGPQSRTTQEIADSLTHGSRRDLNHSIPVTKPLQLPESSLPVDPYVLGLWLGDGSSSDGTITQHPDDAAHITPHIVAAGFDISDRSAENSFGVLGLRSRLREIGVLNDKHIPDEYLFSSYEQRLALLQGLMDTDGTCEKSGHIEFCSTNISLANGVCFLLRSFGMKPVMSCSESWMRRSDGSRTQHKDRYRITCRPTTQVFRIPRKAERIRAFDGVQSSRNYQRMITEVVATGRKVPMRCIKVAHPSSLYLIGEGLIPTHNTRTGAEYIKERMLAEPGCRVGIIGQTIGSARDICVEGESGLLNVLNPKLIQKYNRSLGQLRLKNGAMAFTFSGADPEKLRGFQSHYLWLDELCAFPEAQATYDMGLMGLRLGRNPRMVITTTPKPTPLIVEFVNRSRTEPDRVRITTGSTFDNSANLPDSTLASLRARYEGTTLGRQELYAELVLEEPNALWKRSTIDEHRVDAGAVKIEDMAEIVIGVDPNMSQSTERATECGIVVVGRGRDGHGYLLHDGSMLRPSPDAWANRVVSLYHEFKANQIVAEVNQGYDLVTHTIHTVDATVPVKKVYSVRGKSLRADPIAALSEQGRIHHVGRTFEMLEDQMVQWLPGSPSPDRLDAYVHGFTKLLLGGGLAEFFTPTNLPRLPSTIR